MALALGEDRDQHVGAGHLLAADDWTWITARWITRWKPAVGLESSRLFGDLDCESSSLSI
jgi:hypothetical protein